MSEAASEVTGKQVNQQGASSNPTLVVERFLDLLRSRDIDGAAELSWLVTGCQEIRSGSSGSWTNSNGRLASEYDRPPRAFCW
jgi:hypothetical protein